MEYICKTCGAECSSERGLNIHISRKHSSKDKSSWPTCQLCGHQYSSLKHGICGNCDFKINGRLKECEVCHEMKLFHSNRQKMCSDCKAKLEAERKAETEARKTTPVTCDVCGLECASVRSLNRHKTVKHKEYSKDDSWPECKNCHKKYKELKDGLCGHCNLNINGKDAICEQCHRQVKFYSNRQKICSDCMQKNIDRHEADKAERNKPENLVCSMCGRQFESYAGLRQHEVTHEDDYVRRQFSEETRRKMSEARLGKKFGPISESTRQAIIRSNKTRILSEETRKKMSEHSAFRRFNKDVYDKVAKKTRERFSDPEYKKQFTEKMREVAKTRDFSKSNESREKYRQAALKNWNDPDKRQEMIEKRRKTYSFDRQSEALKKAKRTGWTEDAKRFCDDKDFAMSIFDSFDHKPTYIELQEKLGTFTQQIGKAVLAFGLTDRINYLQSAGHSNEELQILEYTRSFGFDAKASQRVIKPKELDVYVESKKFAIEFDGAYWHNDEFIPKDRHLEKTISCEQLGIHLMHVFEWEWMFKQDIVKSMIKTSLGLADRIYARKCAIIDVDSKTEQAFLEENHIQGYVPSSYKLGLSYDGELVALMTFGKSRFAKSDATEMLRYCCKQSIEVVGGMSKLLKHSIDKFEFTKILSYCDRSKFTGCSYEKLGFEHIKDIVPDYVWVRMRDFDIKTRYQAQMKDEDNIMRSNGYVKVYDCGSKVYELQL